jgi:hypothetical protein
MIDQGQLSAGTLGLHYLVFCSVISVPCLSPKWHYSDVIGRDVMCKFYRGVTRILTI